MNWLSSSDVGKATHCLSLNGFDVATSTSQRMRAHDFAFRPSFVVEESSGTSLEFYSAMFLVVTPNGTASFRNSASLAFINATRSGSLWATLVVSPMSVTR